MAVMQVADVMDAKSGKSLRIKLGDNWYGAYKDSGITRGMVIDPVIETLEKGGPWIVRYTKKDAAPQVSPPPTAHAAAGAAPQFTDNIQPWWSNYVAAICVAGINSGKITSPEGLNQWALKAAQVIVAVKQEVGT